MPAEMFLTYVQRYALSSLHELCSFFGGFLSQEVELAELSFAALEHNTRTDVKMRSRD